MPKKRGGKRCLRCNANQHQKFANCTAEFSKFNNPWPDYPDYEKQAVENWFQYEVAKGNENPDLHDFDQDKERWLPDDTPQSSVTSQPLGPSQPPTTVQPPSTRQSSTTNQPPIITQPTAPSQHSTTSHATPTSHSPATDTALTLNVLPQQASVNLQADWPPAQDVPNTYGGNSKPLVLAPAKTLHEKFLKESTNGAKQDTLVHTIRPGFAGNPWEMPTQSIEPPSGIIKQAGRHVFTNHFKVTLKQRYLYYYDILGLPDDANRKRKENLVQKFIAECPCLHDQQPKFATDNRKIIVAWDDLSLHPNCKHQQLGSTRPASVGDVVAELTVPPPKPRTARARARANRVNQTNPQLQPLQPLLLKCQFQKSIDLLDFAGHVDTEPHTHAFNFSDAVEKLNIVFGSRIERAHDSNQTGHFKAIHGGRNKFFRASGWEPLLGDGENIQKLLYLAVRGYYFTITAGWAIFC